MYIELFPESHEQLKDLVKKMFEHALKNVLPKVRELPDASPEILDKIEKDLPTVFMKAAVVEADMAIETMVKKLFGNPLMHRALVEGIPILINQIIVDLKEEMAKHPEPTEKATIH